MIKKAADFKKAYNEKMRGGNGVVELTSFATPEELNNKGRLFGNITLNPGCGIGYHVHENESELFYVMKGTVLYNDNGVECTLGAGDGGRFLLFIQVFAVNVINQVSLGIVMDCGTRNRLTLPPAALADILQ